MRISATVRLLVGLFLLLAVPARAAVVYVNKNAAGAVHDGKSWSTAFLTVQAAVNASNSGDEAWVAQGTYVENVIIPAPTSVSLFGGFIGTEVSRADRVLGPEATTIDGNAKGTVVTINAPNVALDRFTIRGGSAAGVNCAADGAAITHNVITANTNSGGSYWGDFGTPDPYSGYGGGVICTGSQAIIAYNAITGNFALGYSITYWWDTTTYSYWHLGAGGLLIRGNDITLMGNTITDNSASIDTGFPPNLNSQYSASAYGGGVDCEGQRAVIRGNIISRNTAKALAQQFGGNHPHYPSGYAAGGGLIAAGAGSVVADNLIILNAAIGNFVDTSGSGGVSSNGGGISSGTGAMVANNTIADNGAARGGGVYASGGTLTNNIVAFNVGSTSLTGVSASHNVIFGESTAPGATDITLDPQFVDRAASNYHLKATSPCIDAGDDSVVTPGETDLDGSPRIRGDHVDIGAYETSVPTTSVSVGASVAAPPTAIEGVIYAGGDDGKLYAFTSPGLAPVAGFPVDISAAVGTPVKLNTRPAVYYGKTGKAIYLTTNLGHVVKVWPDGVVAWFTEPLNGPTMSTPAVTPDGNVYVDLGLGTSSVASYLFKLDEVSGVAKYISPYLGSSPAGALLDRSAAIDQRYAYVNASGDGLGSLAVLNQDNLVVRASFAPGEDALAPFLNGRNIYVATKVGSVYKVNGITMSPDLAFGTLGRVQMGEGVTAGPFLDAGGVVYVGTASGKVWKLDGTSGSQALFVDSATNSAVTGLLVTRGVLAFGTANGTLEQVSLTNSSSKSVEALSGPPAGGPVYDPVQNRLIIATTSGQVYSVPGM